MCGIAHTTVFYYLKLSAFRSPSLLNVVGIELGVVHPARSARG